MNIFDFLNEQKRDFGDINPDRKKGIDYLENFLAGDNKDFLYNNSREKLIVAYCTSLCPERLDEITEEVHKFKSLYEEDLKVIDILLFLATNDGIINTYKGRGFNVNTVEEISSLLYLNCNVSIKDSIKILKKSIFEFKEVMTFVNFFSSLSFTEENANELMFILKISQDLKDAYMLFGSHKKFQHALAAGEKKAHSFSICYSYIADKLQQRKREDNKARQEIMRYNHTLQRISQELASHPSYIRPEIMEDIMRMKIEDHIKHAVLDYIYELNNQAHDNIRLSYEKSKVSSKSSLIALFSAYNVDISNLENDEINELKRGNVMKLRQMLDFFANYQIPLDKVVRLAYIDSNIVVSLEHMIKNGILTPEFIAHNLGIMKKGDVLYGTMLTNLGQLSTMKINIKNYPNSLNILLTDLSPALSLLIDYGINITTKTTDISFLADPLLVNKLDLLIENGNDLKSMTSYDILNNSYENLFLMGLSKSLGFEYSEDIYSYFDIDELMPHPESLIPDAYKEIFKYSDVVATLPEFLQPYVIDSNTLCINEVYLSLNRVLRNLALINADDMDGIFYALIYGTNFDFSQVKAIQEELDRFRKR